MKMKLALGVIVSLTAITLNTIPTENSTKIVIENEAIYESNELIREIKDEIEDESVESNSSISEESKSEIKPIKTPPKIKSSNPENYIENEPENANPDSNPPQGKTVHSDGDINKMVGTMD